MENSERIDLVKSAPVDSGIKEALVYLLNNAINSTPSELRMKNKARGNNLPEVEHGDLWIIFTSPTDLKFLNYKGIGNPQDISNYDDMGGFTMR